MQGRRCGRGRRRGRCGEDEDTEEAGVEPGAEEACEEAEEAAEEADGDVFFGERGGDVGVAEQGGEVLAAHVEDAERVLEAGVDGAGVDEVGWPELADGAEPLEGGVVDDGDQTLGDGHIPQFGNANGRVRC